MNGLLSRLPSMSSYRQSPDTSAVSPTTFSSAASKRPEAESENCVNTPLSAPTVVSLYPPLSVSHLELLTAETIHAITAIGGHDNPPARHIVGVEGVASVKEKLKTVSEELEDFIECSWAVDINTDEDAMRAVKNNLPKKIKI